ncbi:MAG: MBL fold metallo-hydrolase [Candidatus Tectomicrobia bacterium]|uniref:MBL fold metallo-hydrolase n=1 Tax=Tectimicrobiota bacterium TaxID=2528274 RepID=A0A932CNR2_UNCTE|nr:MBL fold metallo-hydrolase [Candidatus Tectomicrobia bacterium]
MENERPDPITSSTVLFDQLNEGACKTYLVADETSQEAMLVDPVLERIEHYLRELERRRLSLQYILDTHAHADHISGASALADRTGASYVMHRNAPCRCVQVRVDEGDTLRLGALEIRLLHTPGHTQDSMTLLLPDRILTGDFLFLGQGGAGRTDLPGGDPGEHWDSLQKLQGLSDDLLVFPAHDYHGRSHSTLGEERRTNERLRPWSREAYVAWLNSLKLGPADWMKDVLQANYACAKDPRAAWIPVDAPTCEVKGTAGSVNVQLVQTIAPRMLADQLTSVTSPMILDVREPGEFNGNLGHIQGARLIPVGQLSARLSELDAFKEREIVTVCKSGGRSATAAAILTIAGFPRASSLDGGMLAWSAAHLPVTRDG